MPILRPWGLFSAYRFALRLPNKDEIIPVHAIFQDPFSGNLWIGAAHKGEEPTLMQQLVEVADMEVWLLPMTQRTAARCLPVHVYDKPQWFPLDLDCGRDDVAMEWLCWSDCAVGCVGDPARDVKLDDLPPKIKQMIDPRSNCD